MLYGPPGTGKTLCARAVANRTDATFIRVIGSELVQKYVGEGARMVRELFEMARTKKACIIFFDEVDAIGGARFDDGAGGDNEVQRTMLELINQLDGFDPRGNIKVLMATNRWVPFALYCMRLSLLVQTRPDTLDPALLRPGRIDRRIEFSLPDAEGRAHILRIHARGSVYVLYRSVVAFPDLVVVVVVAQHVGRTQHPFRPHRPSLSQRHRRRAPLRLHRGWHVRHSSQEEGGRGG
jgi:26S proteasome regulatory subunit T1